MWRMVTSAAFSLAVCAPMGAQESGSFAIGALIPAGGLQSESRAGLSASVRFGGGFSATYGYRADLGFDFFNTNAIIKNHVFESIVLNLTHGINGRVYEFVGIGAYRNRIVRVGNYNRTDDSFGAQLGVALNLNWPMNSYVEVGITNLFTPGQSAIWYPVRYGIYF